MYEHHDFNGWEIEVRETSQFDLIGSEDDEASSVKVNSGCTLKLFENHQSINELASLTADISDFNDTTYQDKVSSVSCSCQ